MGGIKNKEGTHQRTQGSHPSLLAPGSSSLYDKMEGTVLLTFKFNFKRFYGFLSNPMESEQKFHLVHSQVMYINLKKILRKP